ANNDSVIKVNNIFTENTEKLKESASNYISQSSSHVKEATNIVNSSLSQTNEQVSILDTDLTTKINQNRTDLDTYKTQLSTSFDEVGIELNTLKSDIANQIQTVEGNLVSTGEEINSKTKAFVEENNEKLAGVGNELQISLNTSVEAEITKFKNQLLTEFDDFKVKLTENVNSKIDQVNSSREEMRLLMNEELGTSLTELSTLVSKSSQNQKELNDKFFNTITESYSSHKSKAAATIDNITSNIQDLVNAIGSSITNMKTSVTEVQTKNSEMNSQFEENQNNLMNTALSEALSEITNLLGHELDSLNQLNEELSNAQQTTFAETIANLINTVSEKANDLEKTLNSFHDTFISNLKETATSLEGEEETEDSATVSSKSIQSEVYQFLKELSSEIDNFSEITHQTLTTFIDGLQSDTRKLISDSEGVITDQSDQLKSITVNKLDQVKTQAGTNKTEQITAVKSSLDDYSSKYSTSSRSVTENTLNLATVLEKLFEVQQATDTPTLNTNHLVGHDAIMYQLEEIISRVKSKVTILVPSIKMINVEQIQNMKSTAQVNIISHIDEDNDKDWIKTMHDADANVTLRSIAKSGFGGELPDFVGVEREGEEILLGTMDDSAKQYVAVTSSSEYFVQILGNIVIADYARGKSKQLQK
ncbi:MAG: hypothetical protein ACW99Q_24855, partial [Candidatus Kariarchaeaceae archaeon]